MRVQKTVGRSGVDESRESWMDVAAVGGRRSVVDVWWGRGRSKSGLEVMNTGYPCRIKLCTNELK